MTTVIRVRRKRNTDALENIVLPLKRAKTNVSLSAGRPGGQSAGAKGQDDNKAVFVFAGTVERKTQPISIHIQSALRRASIGLQPKKPTKVAQQSVKDKTESHRMGAREKARTSHKASSKSRRLKVVDNSRGLKLHELDKDAKVYQSPRRQPNPVSNGSGSPMRPNPAGRDVDRVFSLYDIVHDESKKDVTKTTTTSSKTTSKSTKSGSDEITCNSVQMTREKVVIGEDILQESEYVYDLYYTDCPEFDMEGNENSLGMRSERDELVYELFGSDAPRAGHEEDDDENEEGNWRNDYPDEDPEHKSGTDRDMFDEHLDDYNYASSEDEDLVAQYAKCNLGSKGGDLSDSDIDDYDL